LSIAIACDHGGYALKQEIIKYFDKNNISYADLGTYSTESVDYPDIAIACAEAVARGDMKGHHHLRHRNRCVHCGK